MATISFDPITAVSCRAKKHPLRPRQSYFAPAPSRASSLDTRPRVEAPGTAPGSDRFITEFVYRHSRRKRRQNEYTRSDYIAKGPSAGADIKTARNRVTALSVARRVTEPSSVSNRQAPFERRPRRPWSRRRSRPAASCRSCSRRSIRDSSVCRRRRRLSLLARPAAAECPR